MSVFLVSHSKFENDTFANALSWSDTDPVAAVASYSIDETDQEHYQVVFLNSEGVLIPNATVVHDSEATVFEWQPNGRILIIGWQDGMISCWIVDGRTRPMSTFSNTSQHNTSISIIRWNPSGKRVITGDKRGLICVWSADARGTLTPLRQYKRKGSINAAVFCVLPFRGATVENSRKDNVMKTNSTPSFFFGTDQGALVYADDLGHCTDVQQLPSSIDIMLFFEEKSRLIIITRSLLLSQYQVAEDGRVTRAGQVKLSITGDVADSGLKFVVWAAPGVIAMATHEKFIRLFDVVTDSSYNLSLSAASDLVQKNDRVTTVAFNQVGRYLALGTKMGSVLIWKFVGTTRELSRNTTEIPSTGSADWELIYKTQLPMSVPIPVLRLHWHGEQGALGAVTEDGVIVLSEMVMQCGINAELAVIQTGSHEVHVVVTGQDSWVQHTEVLVKGLAVGKSCYVVWSGKDARVFRVDISTMKMDPVDAFASSGVAMVIADSSQIVEDSVFIADQSIIRVTNFSGVQKGSITFSEAEGVVEHIDLNGRILAAITDKGVIGIYDVHTPKKPKALGSIGRFFDPNVVSFPLSVRKMKVNCDGSRLAIVADQIEGSLRLRHPDSHLHVYDRNKGAVFTYDFAQSKRYPVNIGWDVTDERLLACEAVKVRMVDAAASVQSAEIASKAAAEGAEALEPDTEVEVYTLFATADHGILMQDSFHRKAPYGSFLGLAVPRLYFRNAPVIAASETGDNSVQTVKIFSKVMRDFVGMEDIDETTKFALLDFSYNLTLGRLDEAYRAVKSIENPTLWENMAQMCVKTKRLDVAEVCLGNMGHVRGAAAVRESKKEGSLEVSIGVLAIQLGLYDDAVRLFREANRPDLVNQLYQAAGLWDKAIKTATSSDRIHLKTTYFHLARQLESVGDTDNATKNYIASDTFRSEVPRMLHNLGKMDELEDFVNTSDDPVLLKWWAAYFESKGRYDVARKYYNKAGDYLSMVRILCFKNDFGKAADLVQDTGDRAAAYHLARQFELKNEVFDSINFYAMSGCYNHCIRLAKDNHLDAELMKYAVKSTSSLMLDCASHFELKGEYDKAIQLYHKGGDIPRALDLCFQASEADPSQSKVMFDLMNSIAHDLGADTSPQTLARCAGFLVNHKQYEKAIELYILAKRIPQAIEMCLQQKITINENIVEKLTPTEEDMPDANERKETLKNLAKALKRQGSFVLASTKYTQAGDRVRAIKCLVRSGDTKLVIQYASVSRNLEIYTLAANYLQQMNWRESVDIMKSIIMFYTKAKAWEQLARFYDSCALVEIDEYQDYDKGIEALKESLKYLAKVESPSRSIDDYISLIEKRIDLIEKFCFGKKLLTKDPDGMVKIVKELLQEPTIDDAIRSGDCYALLIEYYYGRGNLQEAYSYLQEMESRRIPLNPYLDAGVIDKIFRANNHQQTSMKSQSVATAPTSSAARGHEDADEVDDEDIREEVDEEVEDETERKRNDDPRARGPVRGGYGRK